MNNFNPLYLVDGYKLAHKRMLAPNTTRLYGTWIPRSTKHAPNGIDKVVSFGQQLTWIWLNDQFNNNFFNKDWSELSGFVRDMSKYLGLPYDGNHFKQLHDLGYLPIKVKALPEGLETPVNVPHMTFINTVDGFAWLTLYLETIVSAASWKASTSATLALKYRRNVEHWVMKTDPSNSGLIPFLCHDFSARGLSPWDMMVSSLGHATSFMGSDSIIAIPASRKYYQHHENEVCVNSVNASEHSVSTTKIFTVGEKQMILDWMKQFPQGILSLVADTFDLWKFITEFLVENKDAIMARDGKIVIRPDSGDPVDIICGVEYPRMDDNRAVGDAHYEAQSFYYRSTKDDKIRLADRHRPDPLEATITPDGKGVIELLWDIFGGIVNDQGYKVLDPHIGAIYGDSITLDRQVEIYKRLEAKGFAATNIVLGVGSFTYQFNTRDTFGFAAKGSWFEVEGPSHPSTRDIKRKGYNIYKDPVTDDGTKKSLKGMIRVNEDFTVEQECSPEREDGGLLQTIFEDGEFKNQQSLSLIRMRINDRVNE